MRQPLVYGFARRTGGRDKAHMSAPRVFDRLLLRQRGRRAGAVGAATFLIDRVAEDMGDRLAAVLRRFDLAVDLGSPTEAVRRTPASRAGAIVAVDAVPQHPAGHAGLKVAADEAALPFADPPLHPVVPALPLQAGRPPPS